MDRSQAVVFDGDDTLWETEALYDSARTRSAEIVAKEGFDADRFQILQRELDIQNVKVLGLSSNRFPTSSVQAYTELARQAGRSPIPKVSEKVYRASAAVFQAPAAVYSDVDNVLKAVSQKCLLGLLTKGDQLVQERRIDQSGLRRYFDAIAIVNNKTDAEFLSILAKLGAPPTDSWSIGNSLGSDIVPALSVGMRAIWIDAHVWGHERGISQWVPDHDRFYEAKTISEVLTIIEM